MTLPQYLHLQKAELLDFWYKFGGRGNNGKGYDPQDKLNDLKRLAEIKYFRRTKSLARYRNHFNKHYKGMFLIPCFVCGNKSEHRHHIIQLQNGGLNSKLNRISLCRNCHISIHPWMQ